MSRDGVTLPPRIAHFDLDSFFVAAERARNPALRGLPVLVGFDGPRGVVSTASYEARAFGCRSAQPMAVALRLCPQAVVVRPDHAYYMDLSGRFHAILRDITPVVESAGIDEAYADLTGLGLSSDAARLAAERVRDRVRAELGVTVSVCIAGSKTTAKVGSDRAKPDGLIEVPVGGDAEFLAPLPIRDLPFVGPKFGEALTRAGIRTIGQAAALDPKWLAKHFGAGGEGLASRARGVDHAPVRAGGREQKQISREVTFMADVEDLAELKRVLQRLGERVGVDLRAHGKRARTVTLKLRWLDFTTLSRSRTLDRPFQASHQIVEAGHALLDETVRAEGFHPVRLIGIGVTNLVEDAMQLGLDDLVAADATPEVLRDERLDHVLDDLRTRFGDRSVRRGV